MMTQPRYVASLSNVREVSLLGTADLGFWKRHLSGTDLKPLESMGKARLLISASSAKFMALAFAEFSVCVLVVPPSGAGGWRDAAYMPQAFNSRRSFAFVERKMYATPYRHARIDMSVGAASAEVHVSGGSVGTYRAAFRAGDPMRGPSRSGMECWNGPVFLPERQGRHGRAQTLFFAKLQGPTRAFAYAPGQDELKITSASSGDVFQMLIESKFRGQEWLVRDAATHAKTKTYDAAKAIASFRVDAG